MTDEHLDTQTPTSNTRNNLSDAEYQAFRAFQDDRIRQSALAEGRASATAEHMADDKAADAAAMEKLSSRGFTLTDVFGPLSTQRGRDVLANIHRSSFSSKSGHYTRLRRLAQNAGIVK
jgi:hypothetical protein